MRYPDGGGLSALGRARREALRLQSAAWFAEGIEPLVVARTLRVSPNSAYVWRRRWCAGGEAADRLVRGGRRRCLKIATAWPWAPAIVTAWDRISALAQAP